MSSFMAHLRTREFTAARMWFHIRAWESMDSNLELSREEVGACRMLLIVQQRKW